MSLPSNIISFKPFISAFDNVFGDIDSTRKKVNIHGQYLDRPSLVCWLYSPDMKF